MAIFRLKSGYKQWEVLSFQNKMPTYLGKKVGDFAEIEVPNGVMKFEIIEVAR